MKRIAAVVMLLLIVLPAFGQVGLRRGDLIRADYGSGNQWIEVTQRVSSLIRGGSLNFRVDNDTLGVDPRPGEVKVLRLQIQDQNGRTRQLTFQENEYVNLRINSGGPYAGGGSGRLQILRADYGAGNRFMDVTARLNSQIQGDQLNLQVTNNTMGGDPAKGQDKTLRVQYAYNGRQGQVAINEGDYIRLPDASATYQGRLQILRADYGAGNRFMDVTARLNSQIQGDQLNLQVTNDTMGGDPAKGQDKTLRVQYTYNGSSTQSIVNEGNYLSLPGGDAYRGVSSYNDGALQITRARYGTGNRMADVTARLNSQIRGGRLSMQVTNETMGGDPSPNQSKTLMVQYLYNGGRGQVVVNEGGTLNLPTDNAPSTSQTIRCESNNNARNYCPVDTRGGVRLYRQISGSACTQGSTWGYDNNRIWVDRGCRADFQVSAPFGADASSTPYGTNTTIPNGTQLAIRTNEVIDSATSAVGQQFSAVMYADVLDSSGAVVIPKGSDVELVIRSTAGSDLVLDIDSLVVAGQRYVVSTSDLEQKGGQGIGANRRTAEMVGGGAAVGAIIGAIVGGGKGAAIGAGVGAAGGAGVEVLTKGKEVRVPAETILNFRLDTDLRLQPARW